MYEKVGLLHERYLDDIINYLLTCWIQSVIYSREQVPPFADGMIFLRNINHYNRKFMQSKNLIRLFISYYSIIWNPTFACKGVHICLKVRYVKWTSKCTVLYYKTFRYSLVFGYCLIWMQWRSKQTRIINKDTEEFHFSDILNREKLWFGDWFSLWV